MPSRYDYTANAILEKMVELIEKELPNKSKRVEEIKKMIKTQREEIYLEEPDGR